jgi:hypothetical protein
MVRSIQAIEKDLDALETILETLAQEFYAAYREYLTALGQSTRQQFILASYQLCTQGFPEAFLQLSFKQRQDLQSTVRSLGQQVERQLTGLIHLPSPSVLGQDFAQDALTPDIDLVSPPPVEDITPLESHEAEELRSGDGVGAIASEAPSNPMPLPLTPRTLAQWQEEIEDSISEILKDISHSANCCFQDAGILSNALPDALLEIASKADMIAENSASAPNLLQLRVETEAEPAANTPPPTQITVIHLRLSEIEFANPELMPTRTKIRDLSNRLAQLHREYQKKHHEKAIAEAESAWRSSWFED